MAYDDVDESDRDMGALILRLAEDRGLDRAALQKATGYSAQYLSNVINGRRRVTPASARRFAAALGVAPAVFLGPDYALDTTVIGTVDGNGRVTMSGDPPGVLLVRGDLDAIGASDGGVLRLERTHTLEGSGWYAIRRRGVVELAGWNGRTLAMMDGERVVFDDGLHEILGRVTKIEIEPRPPE